MWNCVSLKFSRRKIIKFIVRIFKAKVYKWLKISLVFKECISLNFSRKPKTRSQQDRQARSAIARFFYGSEIWRPHGIHRGGSAIWTLHAPARGAPRGCRHVFAHPDEWKGLAVTAFAARLRRVCHRGLTWWRDDEVFLYFLAILTCWSLYEVDQKILKMYPAY